MNSFADALDASAPRPADDAARKDKKNYGERLSRNIAWLIANRLRPQFPGILPDENGQQQESRARSGRGLKRLDVNYSTVELGLGLGVSIKTINYRDSASGRYTKNYSRNDNELRAEAKDYHQRQPFAVLVAVLFLPIDSCDDGRKSTASSFGRAVRYFRSRALRQNPRNEEELFERFFIGLYEHAGPNEGEVRFFDVANAPPKQGRPPLSVTIAFAELIEQIVETYDARNKPPFEWAT